MFDPMPRYEMWAFVVGLGFASHKPPALLEAGLVKLCSDVAIRMAGADPAPLSGAWS